MFIDIMLLFLIHRPDSLPHEKREKFLNTTQTNRKTKTNKHKKIDKKQNGQKM
jgi:hypothetical protein